MEKPPRLTKLAPLERRQVEPFKQVMTKERDEQQANLREAQAMRANLSLKIRSRYINFMQRLGELSLTFGAALVPIVIITNANKDLRSPLFVFLGSALYLVNGVFGLVQTKVKLEQDVDDAPYIGLDEEIMTYPLIHAKNKWILEPDNVDYANEHIAAEWNITHRGADESASKKRPNVWADLLLFNFVVASLLVAGTLWPYPILWYLLPLDVVILCMLSLIEVDYRRALKSRDRLNEKRHERDKLKADFSKWREDKFRNNK